MLDKHRFGQFPLLDDRKGKNCLLNSTQPLIKPMSQNNKRKKMLEISNSHDNIDDIYYTFVPEQKATLSNILATSKD